MIATIRNDEREALEALRTSEPNEFTKLATKFVLNALANLDLQLKHIQKKRAAIIEIAEAAGIPLPPSE